MDVGVYIHKVQLITKRKHFFPSQAQERFYSSFEVPVESRSPETTKGHNPDKLRRRVLTPSPTDNNDIVRGRFNFNNHVLFLDRAVMDIIAISNGRDLFDILVCLVVMGKILINIFMFV